MRSVRAAGSTVTRRVASTAPPPIADCTPNTARVTSTASANHPGPGSARAVTHSTTAAKTTPPATVTHHRAGTGGRS